MSRKPEPMTNPITNRGTAFTRAERLEHGMIGRLPGAVETLEQQLLLQGLDGPRKASDHAVFQPFSSGKGRPPIRDRVGHGLRFS